VTRDPLCKLANVGHHSPVGTDRATIEAVDRRTGQDEDADAFLRGFATALAEMHRGLIAAGDDPHLARVARDCGLTLSEARRIGVNPRDVERLHRAGVAR